MNPQTPGIGIRSSMRLTHRFQEVGGSLTLERSYEVDSGSRRVTVN
jgi:hypothetical protein